MLRLYSVFHNKKTFFFLFFLLTPILVFVRMIFVAATVSNMFPYKTHGTINQSDVATLC